ncbi:hypothetical protein [Clostridium beijerinckii]|jgi:hypothetical protein|nr:hypothetical protein [Clostridium beijerinckii]
MNKDLKKFGFELITVLIMAAAPIISNFVNGKYDVKEIEPNNEDTI